MRARKSLSVRRSSRGQIELFVLDGDLDGGGAPWLRREIDAALDDRQRFLLFDLEGVQAIDQAGLAVLVQALERVRPHGGRVLLAGANAEIGRMFEITGLRRALPLRPDREAAFSELAEWAVD